MKFYNELFLKRLNIFSVSSLITFGILLNVSASSVQGSNLYNDNFYFIKRHLIALIFGFALFKLIQNIPLNYIKKFSSLLIGLTTLALFFVLDYGVVRGGSRRWFDFGLINLQPSEVAKPIIILFVAYQLSLAYKDEKLKNKVIRVLFLPVVCSLLILVQPDFGTAATIGFIVLVQILFSKVTILFPISTAILLSPLAIFVAKSSNYRFVRIQTWLDKNCDYGEDLLGACYQLHQSRIAISSGGFIGLGPGTSRSRWGSLPNAYSDFIASIIGEEYGYFGMFIMILLFFLLIISTFLIALINETEFKQHFIFGFGAWMLFQTIINLGGAVGIFPITGMVLPFISYGSTAMVSTFIGLGIMYSKYNE